MDKVMRIPLPEKFLEYLEQLNYEVHSRQSMIAYALKFGLYDAEAFQVYKQEYIEYFIQYSYIEQEMINTYINPSFRPCRWEVDFKENCLLVYPSTGGTECV